MNNKFRFFVQHGSVNDNTLRCDLLQYCYWSCSGRKTPWPNKCYCKRCVEYRDNLRKKMIDRIKKDGLSVVCGEVTGENIEKSIWDDVE